jgi:hypothetical protein
MLEHITARPVSQMCADIKSAIHFCATCLQ